MPPFLICVHDATPAYAPETERIVRDLAPLVGRCFAFGVVPNWHGAWPLDTHSDYCGLLRESADELLLHGYFHRRGRGRGPVTWLAEGSDELGGLSARETAQALERGQRVFTDVFGERARGFVAPAWQRGCVRATGWGWKDDRYVLGFFSLDAGPNRTVRLATWTWDCGRWGWLGHVGHAAGRVSQLLGRVVPSLAIHPRDLERGFWPKILRLIRELLDAGYEPTAPAALLEASHAQAAL